MKTVKEIIDFANTIYKSRQSIAQVATATRSTVEISIRTACKLQEIPFDELVKNDDAAALFLSSSILNQVIKNNREITIELVANMCFLMRQAWWLETGSDQEKFNQLIKEKLKEYKFTLKDIISNPTASALFTKSSVLKPVLTSEPVVSNNASAASQANPSPSIPTAEEPQQPSQSSSSSSASSEKKPQASLLEVARFIYSKRDEITLKATQISRTKTLPSILFYTAESIKYLLSKFNYTLADIQSNSEAKAIFNQSERLKLVLHLYAQSTPQANETHSSTQSAASQQSDPRREEDRQVKELVKGLIREQKGGLRTQLNIAPQAWEDEAELRKLLKLEQLRLHPDKNNGESPNPEKLNLVNAAQDLLKNGQKENYDEIYKARKPGN